MVELALTYLRAVLLFKFDLQQAMLALIHFWTSWGVLHVPYLLHGNPFRGTDETIFCTIVQTEQNSDKLSTSIWSAWIALFLEWSGAITRFLIAFLERDSSRPIKDIFLEENLIFFLWILLTDEWNFYLKEISLSKSTQLEVTAI